MKNVKRLTAAALVIGSSYLQTGAEAQDAEEATTTHLQPEIRPEKKERVTPGSVQSEGSHFVPQEDWVEDALRYYANPFKRLELEIEEAPDPYITYTVADGESLSEIAHRFELSLQEIAEQNEIADVHRIRAGQELKLRLNEVKYVVRHGDTLEKIARHYEVELGQLLAHNSSVNYHQQTIFPGQTLRIPTSPPPPKPKTIERDEKEPVVVASRSQTRTQKPAEQREEPAEVAHGQSAAVDQLAWPLQGQLTSRFGMRWGRMHNGIDISAKQQNAAIYASASGKVREAGYRNGYGHTVVIHHGNGLETYYAHLSRIAVSQGQSVAAGEKIGNQGRSGNATGHHLHFEVRLNGQPIDPLPYLP